MQWRHIPNIFSVARVLMVLPVAFSIVQDAFGLALILFLAAGLSDGLDGYLARKYDWESAFGKMFDPVADKLLVLGVAVSLVYTGHLPMLLMCLMLVKDFVVIFGAFIYTLLAGFPEVRPLMIGKVTTAMQIILIACLLITAALQPVIAPWVMPALFWMVAVTTFIDGIIYLWVWTGKLRFDERYY